MYVISHRILFLFTKYSLVIEGDSDGNPIEVVLHDKMILSLGCLYAVIVFFILYLTYIYCN